MVRKRMQGQKVLVTTNVNFIAAMHETFVPNWRKIVCMQLLPICHGKIILIVCIYFYSILPTTSYISNAIIFRGVMTGHKNVSDLQSMYEVFLRTAWYVLKDKARIVMLVLRGLQLTRIIRKLSGRYR